MNWPVLGGAFAVEGVTVEHVAADAVGPTKVFCSRKV